tara:strand:- start:1459 stop:1806 length:348 start_codon:yes stop_codon:yes gene_type:complete
MSQAKIVNYKHQKKFKSDHYSKLVLLQKFKVLKGMNYIVAALTKIKLQKEMFVLELEMGHEVFIPKELQIDNYPISYQFYDSIINHTQSTASVETKEYFKFKNNFRFNFYKNENF